MKINTKVVDLVEVEVVLNKEEALALIHAIGSHSLGQLQDLDYVSLEESYLLREMHSDLYDNMVSFGVEVN